MGHRSVLQTDQADLTGLRLPRPLKAGHSLAALVGASDVFATAFPSMVLGLATQLCSLVYNDSGCGLGSLSAGRYAAILWDSR